MIIGVSGKIGAGKDAVASHLVKRHGFKLVRFSDPLKEEVLHIMRKTCEEICKTYALLGGGPMVNEPTEQQLRYLLWEGKPPIIRRLLQEWGTELRRNEHPGYWVRKWTIAARECEEAGISVVTSDTRFLDEAAAVKLLGGYVIRVNRPGLPVGDHASETEFDTYSWDHCIENNGTLDDLAVRVDKFLSSFLPE